MSAKGHEDASPITTTPLRVARAIELAAAVGRELALSRWLAVTQEEIDRFVALTGTGTGFIPMSPVRRVNCQLERRSYRANCCSPSCLHCFRKSVQLQVLSRDRWGRSVPSGFVSRFTLAKRFVSVHD